MTLAVEGKTILVTGGNSGIGFAAARVLSGAGATVILTSRDRGRAEAAASKITGETGREVIGLPLDLASKAAINAFVDDFPRRFDRIDVLVNNAGAAFWLHHESPDGYELTWAVNHLGPFLLTSRLLPLLRRAGKARIVTTASTAHLSGRIEFDDHGHAHSYAPMAAYSRSKLGNVLFTFALARRLEGSGITTNCLHPGVVASRFFRFVPVIGSAVQAIATPFLRSPRKGAETLVFLAGDTEMDGKSGGYYFDKKPGRVSRPAFDEALQEKVWTLSVDQTGAVWDFGE